MRNYSNGIGGSLKDSIVVSDVSGSMSGTPMVKIMTHFLTN